MDITLYIIIYILYMFLYKIFLLDLIFFNVSTALIREKHI